MEPKIAPLVTYTTSYDKVAISFEEATKMLKQAKWNPNPIFFYAPFYKKLVVVF